jgi:hypothetical protein
MKTISRAICVCLLVMGAISTTWSQVSITTESYDASRTGANLSETILTTSNVNSSEFGKLYSYSLAGGGSIYAQPLYVPGLSLPGLGTYNVLFVVTMNDVVYALDADSNATNGNGVLWMNNLTNPAAGVTPIPIANIVQSNSLNIVGNVGIESTPVIDLSTKTMYLVARTMEVSGTTTNYVTRLHALDITTGSEKFGGPVIVQGSVPGTGQASSGGELTFEPLIHNQRSSLALVNGMVVFAFASHEDLFDWHGWVFAFNAQTLQSSGIFCTTPNGQNGGLWMSGRAPVIDSAGNLYYATGNGDWDGESSFGDSVLKLSTTGGSISLVDYFTPDNYASLQGADADLGSSGPLLIPGTSLLVHGGKESILYLLNTSGLGHEASGNGQIVQSFATAQTGEIHGGPVFWNRTTNDGPTMYIWPNNGGSMEAYQFNGSTFNTTPISQSTIAAPEGQSGGVLTLSANGSTIGSGIVWASMPISGDGDHGLNPGVLRAFDANNLNTELWDSQLVSSRDAMGIWPKYSPPTVVNGKVYMAAFPSDGVSAGAISVYGLLNPTFSMSISPSAQTVVVGNATTFTTSIGAVEGFSGVVTLSASGLPAGATPSFVPATVTGSGPSTLTVTTSATTPLGTYPLTITGTSGSLKQTANVSMTVAAVPPPPNFSLTVTPSTQTVAAGSATTSTASIVALNGFGGVVTLSASGLPAGATPSFVPATVTGAGSSTLTVTTSATTPLGTYPVTITGKSGSLTQTANVTLAVTNVAPIGIQFVGQGTAMASTEVAGVVAQSNWNPATGTASTTPLALLDQNGNRTNATVTWNTNGIWSEPIANTPGNYRMMLGYLDTVGGTTTVKVAGLPANAGGYQVYVYADGDNPSATRTGGYQISGTGITTTSVNLIDEQGAYFSGTFTQANNSSGNYVLFTITATGFTITATPGASSDGDPRAPVNAIQIVPLAPTTPTFSLTAAPSTQTVIVGNATSYTASVAAVDGFSGVVTLSASGLPAGATPSFVPTTVTGSGPSTLTVTTSATTPLGTYPLTITGTSGSLKQTANVSMTVAAVPPPPNFSLTVTPSTQTVAAGSATTSTASIVALNGFGGVVTLSASGLPAGATPSFVPATVTGAGSSTLTVTTSATTPLGTYPVTITGKSGSLTQTANVTLAVTNVAPIGIQFVGQGTAMASTEVAGVVAQSNWNPATGTASTTPLALLDQNGNRTNATVTWNTNGIWSEPIANTPGNYRMMLGYLDTVGGTTTVKVAGLPANAGGYQVYVYADGDNPSATRTGGYQISGTGITTTSVNLIDEQGAYFSGTFTQANNSSGNYVLFTITTTGFTITATPGASPDGDPRAPVNAIQIVPN